MGGDTFEQTKLETICARITVGHVGPMASEYVPVGIPFLRSQNILPFRLHLDDIKFITPGFHAKLKKSALRPGDVAVIRTGYPGVAAVIPASLPDSNCADLVVISPDSTRLDPYFLAAIFNSTWGKGAVAGNLVGAAQQHFNIGAARNLSVSLPPLEVQRRIVGVLCAYDHLIENCRRRILVLNEMARALYREWFVNFHYPGHEKVPLVDSALGKIPRGWAARRLSDVARLIMGQSPKSEFYNETGEGLPFHQGVTNFGERFPTDRVFCTGEARLAEEGDILFSVRAPVGRMNIAQRRLALGRGLSAIRHFAGRQCFLWEQLRATFTREDMIGNGAIFAAVTKQEMEDIEVVAPVPQLVGLADERLAVLSSIVAVLDRSVTNLHRTRELVLPRLLSGQLSVADLAA